MVGIISEAAFDTFLTLGVRWQALSFGIIIASTLAPSEDLKIDPRFCGS
jgi:hypothetical protein